MKGLSKKEIKLISWLEFENKEFFTRRDIKKFFKNKNEMNVYIHKLMKKGRIVKINKTKYYLIPIKAFEGYWTEHPFVIVDEIFNGKDYFIGGKAAANYWKIIPQIPTQIDVYTTKKQGTKEILGVRIRFIRTTEKNMRDFVTREIGKHKFIIASKKRSMEWM